MTLHHPPDQRPLPPIERDPERLHATIGDFTQLLSDANRDHREVVRRHELLSADRDADHDRLLAWTRAAALDEGYRQGWNDALDRHGITGTRR